MPEVLTPSHLAYAVIVVVGSPDVSRNSRQSEVPTQAGSPGIGGSGGLLSVLVGTPDTWCGLAGCLTAHVGSPNVRRKSRRLPRVPTLTCTRELLALCEQCFLLTSEVPRSATELPT